VKPSEIIEDVTPPTMIEPQDAPVFIETPVVRRPTTSEVIARLPRQEAPPSEEGAGVAEALAAGAKTPEQARAERMAESAARRSQAPRETPGESPRLTARRIVDIAKTDGGMEVLKGMGVDKIDVLRAINELKQQERNLPDEVLGFGLGGGAEQFREAMGLAARGVVKSADFLGDVINFANRPGDKIADGINRVYWQNIGKPWAARNKAMANYFREVFPPTAKAHAKWAAWAVNIAPLKWGPLVKAAGIKRELNEMTDDFGAVSLMATNKQAHLREMEAPAVEAIKKMLKVDDPTAYEILMAVSQYGERGDNGRRDGPEVIRDVLARHADSPWLTERLKRNLGEAIRIIENYDSMPTEVKLAVEFFAEEARMMERDMKNSGQLGEWFEFGVYQTRDAADRAGMAEREKRPEYDWRIYRSDRGYVVAGTVGARRPGVAYHPGYMTKDITKKRKPAFRRDSARATESPATKERHVRGGYVERLLRLGEAPATYSLSEMLGAMHRNTYRPIVAQKAALGLTGYEIGGMPAAIRRSVKDKMEREAGRKLFDGYEDYSAVPGFKVHNPDGTADALLLHPEMQRAVGNIFEQGYSHRTTRLNSKLKTLKLTLSPFHFWALSMNSLAYGDNPIKTWKNHKQITNSAEARRLVRAGLTTDAADVHLSGFGYDAVHGSPSIGGRLKRAAARGEQYFSRKLWEELYRSTKIASALMAERAYLEQGLSPKEATERAVMSVNALHGGLNHYRWGMSVRAKQMASFFMLAPDWTISNAMWSMQALNPSDPSSAVERKALARYAATAYVMGNLMNYMLSGHMMWENDPEHRHQVQMNIDGEARYLDPWGHFAETFEVLVGFVNMVKDEDLPHGRDPARWLKGKIAPLLGEAISFGTGQTRYPEGYALPTVGDLLEGKSRGEWGKHQHSVDAWLIEAAKAGMNISMVNTFNAAIERGPEWYKDPKAIAGILGRQVYEDSHKSDTPKKPTRPERPSR